MLTKLQLVFCLALVSAVLSVEVLTQIGQTGANVHLVVSGSTALLVDAGGSGDVELVTQFLNDNGIGSADLTAIFITHGHPDHFGALAGLLDNFDTTAIVATQTIKDDIVGFAALLGDTFDYSSTLEIQRSGGLFADLSLSVYTNFVPGESNGASILYNREQNFALVGDIIYSNAHLYLGSGITFDTVRAWRDENLPKFDKGGALSFDKNTVFYVGHGLSAADQSNVPENQDYINFFLDTLFSCFGSDFPTLQQVDEALIAEYPDYTDELFVSFLVTNAAWTDAQDAQGTCGQYEVQTTGSTASTASTASSNGNSSSDASLVQASFVVFGLFAILLM